MHSLKELVRKLPKVHRRSKRRDRAPKTPKVVCSPLSEAKWTVRLPDGRWFVSSSATKAEARGEAKRTFKLGSLPFGTTVKAWGS